MRDKMSTFTLQGDVYFCRNDWFCILWINQTIKKQRTLLKIIHRNVVKSDFVMNSIFSQAGLYSHWAMNEEDLCEGRNSIKLVQNRRYDVNTPRYFRLNKRSETNDDP